MCTAFHFGSSWLVQYSEFGSDGLAQGSNRTFHGAKLAWEFAKIPSLSNLASMLRLNLFTYRDLTAWLDNPFGTPPILPQSQQLTLALA
jgi:hypothetical protein